MNQLKGTLALLAVFAFILPALAQDMSSCDGTGRYCFADSVYDCVNGVPKQIEYCKGVCEAGRCVEESLAPAVSHTPEKPPQIARGDDWIPIITLTIVAVVILAFSLQMIKAKRKAER